MALQATCGSTNATGREVIAPPAAGAANAVESKMGRRKRCASDGGSGAESKCYTTCAALELHEHSFLFLTRIANLQDYKAVAR